jgi:YidC/Oxa1 family membrane protein insertase
MLFSLVLVLAMTATTFTTQRQLMSKNMPADAMSGPYAQQQKMLLYILPVAFGLGGVAFPIGVLLYWTTSNLWTMGQQFYVIRNNPAPGTPAFKAKEERDRAKAAKHGKTDAETVVPEPEPEIDRRPAQRQQPKKQTRAQRRQASGKPGNPQSKNNPKKGGSK